VVTLGEGRGSEEEGEQDGGEPNPNRHGRLPSDRIRGDRGRRWWWWVFAGVVAVWLY
jgi:hypothetical protein